MLVLDFITLHFLKILLNENINNFENVNVKTLLQYLVSFFVTAIGVIFLLMDAYYILEYQDKIDDYEELSVAKTSIRILLAVILVIGSKNYVFIKSRCVINYS